MIVHIVNAKGAVISVENDPDCLDFVAARIWFCGVDITEALTDEAIYAYEAAAAREESQARAQLDAETRFENKQAYN